MVHILCVKQNVHQKRLEGRLVVTHGMCRATYMAQDGGTHSMCKTECAPEVSGRQVGRYTWNV